MFEKHNYAYMSLNHIASLGLVSDYILLCLAADPSFSQLESSDQRTNEIKYSII